MRAAPRMAYIGFVAAQVLWLLCKSGAATAVDPIPPTDDPMTAAPCVFHRAQEHFQGSCGAAFEDQPKLTLAPAAAIKSGVWREDIHPTAVWSGQMTYEGEPSYLLELEIYRGGWGVLRTERGWFPVSDFVAGANLNFKLDTSKEAAPSVLDRKILQRAAALLSSADVWNRADDRKCPEAAKIWSIYCAMQHATSEVTGGFNHRRPALEVVRQIVDERTEGRKYHHRLMEYNNDPTTHLGDVQSLFTEALARVDAGKAPPVP